MATPDYNQTPNPQTPHTTVNKTSNTGTGIVIGVLVVLVLGFGFYYFSGGDPMDTSNDINVTVEGAGDAVKGAAESVEDAAESATGN
ncbi:hypothetical protein [Sulfitobacter sp. CW3]|uniref:hypothetical protein n=1 Tax=Sulfitobacter sp. CW3 TaxID=2861965 RepID=UPI001C600A2B|nr:hypothetical protein [Sulfitobacter sp. CW3]MBW4963977.1 hypothetical protein [Sulfitobacter sp. CW3]